MFRALGLHLYRDEEQHPQNRTVLVNYVAAHWSPVYEALTSFTDRAAYCELMLRDGEYGGGAEGRAAGEQFRRSVFIVQHGVVVASSLQPGDLHPILLRRTGHGRCAHYDLYITPPPGLDLTRGDDSMHAVQVAPSTLSRSAGPSGWMPPTCPVHSSLASSSDESLERVRAHRQRLTPEQHQAALKAHRERQKAARQ